MTLPGPVVINRDAPPSRSAPTDTGTWFAAGFADNGPSNAAVKVTSLKQFKAVFGARVQAGSLSDSIETFFRVGGAVAYVGRVVGPLAVNATHPFNDSASTATLRVTARHAGGWGNGLNVEIASASSGTFKFIVSHDDDVSVSEESPSFATGVDAEDWDSEYVIVTDLVESANAPGLTSAGLTGGDDDYQNATDVEWAAAADLFLRNLGPGQVSFPGRTSGSAHSELLSHAVDNNRIALLDGEDTATVSTLTTATATAAGYDGASYGALFAPWAVIPGTAGGTTRTVPYSAVQAGLEARRDAAGFNPNVPAAGVNGQPSFVIDLARSWSDTDRETLNDAGVNVAKVVLGGIRTYGYRTLVDPAVDPLNWQLGNSRLRVAITAKAEEIAEEYVFGQIDGKGRAAAAFAGDLTGLLSGYYASGGLYGNTPEEAFRVDVGPSVNTPESIAAGQLRAVVAVRMSPMSERVIIEIVKSPITEGV